MNTQSFAGDKKVEMRSPTAALERKLIERFIDRVPACIETYHLTMLTILWTAGLLGFCWLGKENSCWLWLSSLMIFLQWFTDLFDGALGRHRNTGLVRWGFYMDHLLDYFFMGAVFLGYAFLLEPPAQTWMFVLMLVYGGLEASSWLSFAATNRFKITFFGLGPTELRLGFVLVNTALIFYGTSWLAKAVPWIVLGAGLLTIVIAWENSKTIWALDMAQKKANTD